jgi:hypothetical protein
VWGTGLEELLSGKATQTLSPLGLHTPPLHPHAATDFSFQVGHDIPSADATAHHISPHQVPVGEDFPEISPAMSEALVFV